MFFAPSLHSVSSSVLLTTLLANIASAHLFMNSPTPIQGSAPKDPLESSGANFPCHGVALPSSGGQAMKAGSNQTLSFELGGGANTAVHGGGSCQLSLTYETDPAKVKDPSNWHVIYSIEGGCPANTVGNLASAVACADGQAGMSQANCMHSFDFGIPSGVKSGHATLAWTWFNTIGNREMYMNCANVNIEGGDGSEMSSLPSMFVANLESVSGTCASKEQTNVGFPNPGKYMTVMSAAGVTNYPVATPSGCGAAAGGSPSYPTGSSSPSSSSPVAYSPPAATSAPAYSSPAASSSASYAAPTSYAPPATMSTVTGSAPTATAPSNGTYGGSSSGSGSGSSSGTSCTQDGAIVCIGSTQFGICDHGKAMAQTLASGTTCSSGVISRKRVIRHAARHLGARSY